jgi:hypothetical protein
VCSVLAPANQYIGEPATLLASCTGNPTSYQWTGCASTTYSCTATSSTAGNVTYTVTASNAAGASKIYSATVSWYGLAPYCTVTPSATMPKAGTSVTLEAGCLYRPTSLVWSNCAGSGTTCIATSAVAGPQQYLVTATNEFGTYTGSTIVFWQP